MTEGTTPDRTQPDLPGPNRDATGFPVVGEPPPPPGGRSADLEGDDHERISHRRWDGGFGDRGAAAATKRRNAVRTLEEYLREESPWMLGSAALLFALAAFWLASFVTAFQHAPAMTWQDRVFLLLTPGSLIWGTGAVLAVALHAAGRRFELEPDRPGQLRRDLPPTLFAASVASATSAALDVLVELTDFGHGIDRAFSGMLGYIGVIGLAGAAAWWAHRESEATRTP